MIPSDEVLARQAADLKDTAAYAELVRRHQQKILLLQRRLTRDRALAEDLTQDTFIRAWEKLATFQGSGSFGGWLASLSYNVFRAHWRRQGRRLDTVPVEDVSLTAPEPDDGLADLERLLGMLDREDQVLMILSYACGLSSTEAGEVLGMPAGTVKARIHRAKARIREQIENPDSLTAARPPERSASPPGTVTGPLRPLARAIAARFTGNLKGAYRL